MYRRWWRSTPTTCATVSAHSIPSRCTTSCGDGLVAGAETCDDGNTAADDGCGTTCAVEPGWYCVGEPSSCVEICGDGLVVGAEACDDGGTDPDDGCSATCTIESGWSCQGDGLPAQRAAVTCMLNRLILLTAGNDPKLAELFARAELRRTSCATASPAAPSADWVTSAGNPLLRGTL